MEKEKIPGVLLFLIYNVRWITWVVLRGLYFITWFLINKNTAIKVARLAHKIDPDPRKNHRRDITDY